MRVDCVWLTPTIQSLKMEPPGKKSDRWTPRCKAGPQRVSFFRSGYGIHVLFLIRPLTCFHLLRKKLLRYGRPELRLAEDGLLVTYFSIELLLSIRVYKCTESLTLAVNEFSSLCALEYHRLNPSNKKGSKRIRIPIFEITICRPFSICDFAQPCSLCAICVQPRICSMYAL